MHRISSGLVTLLAAIALGVPAPRAIAQKNNAAIGIPPQPVALSLKVKREVRTEIPLRIVGRRNEPLKYLIRTAPAHGQLSEIRQTEKEAAVVIYEPPADLSITRDKFMYAVQSSEGVSAAVEVSLTIVDAPPVLLLPEPVEFARVLAGTVSTKLIELSNHGGGLAIGQALVDAPWRIDGVNTYRLAGGEVAMFKLVFEPKAGGAFEGAVRFTSDRERSTPLRGEAFAPLAVSPEKIMLENAGSDPVRTGSFDILNQTDQARLLKIQGGQRLQTPEQVNVLPHAKVSVPVQTSAADLKAIDGEIRIESAGFSVGVQVKSPPVGAILRVVPDTLSLGKLPAGKLAAKEFEIENLGGSPGAFALEIAAPFQVEPSSAIVQAGERQTGRIKIPPSPPGKYRTWLRMKGSLQNMEIAVDADLYGSAGGPRQAVAETGIVKETSSANSPVETVKAEPIPESEGEAKPSAPTVPLDWTTDPTLPQGVSILATTSTSATFAWPEALSSRKRFRIELRHLGFDASRSLSVEWLEHRSVTIERNQGQYVATLRDLTPALIWAARVLPLDKAGQPGPRLFAIEFSTPPAVPVIPHISLLQWLFAAMGVIFFVGIWRYVRQPRSGVV